jgi:hypothetical protein
MRIDKPGHAHLRGVWQVVELLTTAVQSWADLKMLSKEY